MARRARELSGNGMYHIYFSGNGRDKIFNGYDDCEKFLEITAELKDTAVIFAYGFNNGDGHLFLKTDELSSFMKKLMTKYAMWFNRKYKRRGALFCGRYKSAPVYVKYAAGLSRYIAGKCRYNFLADCKAGKAYADLELVLSFFDSEEIFLEYMKQPELYTYGADVAMNSAEVYDEFEKAVGGKKFLSLDNKERAAAVVRLTEFGLTKSEIARLAGVSRGTVFRCVKIEEEFKRAEINRRNEEVILL